MAPHEVVHIIDILSRRLSTEEVVDTLRELKAVTIDKEYQAVLVRLEQELARRR